MTELGAWVRAAKFMTLNARASTTEMEALGVILGQRIEANESRTYKRGPEKLTDLQHGAVAVAYDVLAVDPGRWVRHSLRSTAFTGGLVSKRTFRNRLDPDLFRTCFSSWVAAQARSCGDRR
jgi:hypothetical protein